MTTRTKATSADPTLVPMQPDFETWKNVSAGMVGINRLGEYGRPRTELIRGGMTFNITPQERRLNQNVVAVKRFDVFTNGTLQPLQLLDSEFDTDSLRQNPNTLDEPDIEKLFRFKGERFRERLEQIDNPAVLTRLIELAREPRFQCTVQQYEFIKLRERALLGGTEQEALASPDGERKPRPVTPK